MKLPLWTATAAALGLGLLWPAAATTPGSLAADVARVESVRAIKDLQKTFSQLAHAGRWADMAALFGDTGVLRWGAGKADVLSAADATALTGSAAIAAWLKTDAGAMDGIRPGSLNLAVSEQPLISLSGDGRSAKGRWHALRLMGDGAGKTRIEGGVFENEYAMGPDGRWKFSLLRFYPMFIGDYKDGWKNAGAGDRTLPIIPYHFTADQAGIPVLLPEAAAAPRSVEAREDVDLENLEYRISQLNEEDEVRNLQHAYGYYVDRRMWTDAIDLFAPDATFNIDGTAVSGAAAIRKTLEKTMGPEGLTQGILNEHNIFMAVVEMHSSGREATSRGLDLAMLGDVTAKSATWDFNIFRNSFVKDADSGIWKIKAVTFTRLLEANYSAGWGSGGNHPAAAAATPPAFLDLQSRGNTRRPADWQPFYRDDAGNTTTALLADLRRRLARSAAFDETENISAAYGYYADDIRCPFFAALFAEKGFKESPGLGFFVTPKRISQACTSRYGSGTDSPQRQRVPFHWRPQPVILVSHDGRSTTLRARILQTGTGSGSSGGFSGVYGFNGGMYQDQFVLEDYKNGTSRRKLWCLTIDEFYWQSSSWPGGWASVTDAGAGAGGAKGKGKRQTVGLTRRQDRGFLDQPDVSLKDPKMVERETGFNGGPTTPVRWPRIQTMWWNYRNPVTGRVPEAYWAPGCVPCRTAKPEWALTKNGFQEPPTGPTLMATKVMGSTITVSVSGGPEEPASGNIELRMAGRSANLVGHGTLSTSGTLELAVPPADSFRSAGANKLQVYYLGSERLKPARATVEVTI